MTRQDIIDKVKVEMDELTPFDGGLLVAIPNTLTKPIDAYIESILDDCAENVILIAPVHLLSLKAYAGAVTVTDGCAMIATPSDMLAIGTVKLAEWERPVSIAIKETDPLYLRQKNKYTRAGISRPVVALTPGVIECYSATTTESSADATGVDFKYRAKVAAEELPDSIIMALVYFTAAKLFKVFELLTLIEPTTALFQNELNSR